MPRVIDYLDKKLTVRTENSRAVAYAKVIGVSIVMTVLAPIWGPCVAVQVSWDEGRSALRNHAYKNRKKQEGQCQG